MNEFFQAPVIPEIGDREKGRPEMHSKRMERLCIG